MRPVCILLAIAAASACFGQKSHVPSSNGSTQGVAIEFHRFQADAAEAKTVYPADHSKAVRILSRWARRHTFRSSANYALLMLISPDDERSARRLIRKMSSDSEWFSRFNLAKFALFPPSAAHERKGYMEPLRVYAVQKSLTGYRMRRNGKRSRVARDRRVVADLELLVTASNAYMVMGRYSDAMPWVRRMRQDVRRIHDLKIRQTWADTASTTYRDCIHKVPPETSRNS